MLGLISTLFGRTTHESPEISTEPPPMEDPAMSAALHTTCQRAREDGRTCPQAVRAEHLRAWEELATSQVALSRPAPPTMMDADQAGVRVRLGDLRHANDVAMANLRDREMELSATETPGTPPSPPWVIASLTALAAAFPFAIPVYQFFLRGLVRPDSVALAASGVIGLLIGAVFMAVEVDSASDKPRRSGRMAVVLPALLLAVSLAAMRMAEAANTAQFVLAGALALLDLAVLLLGHHRAHSYFEARLDWKERWLHHSAAEAQLDAAQSQVQVTADRLEDAREEARITTVDPAGQLSLQHALAAVRAAFMEGESRRRLDIQA